MDRVIENLDENECLRLLGAGRVGRVAYAGRYGPMVLPVVYKLYEGSIVFHALQGTFMEPPGHLHGRGPAYRYRSRRLPGRLRDRPDRPDARGGWTVLVLGSAHHVDTEAERASIINAGANPWPRHEAESVHLVRVQPVHIRGRRSYPQ